MDPVSSKPSTLDVIVIKHKAFVFIVFILGGTFFFICPWLINNGPNFWAICFYSLMGTFTITVGILGWRKLRIGLIVDKQGIWFSSPMPRKTRIPWTSIVSAKKVEWKALDGENEGILLELQGLSEYPGGEFIKAKLIEAIKRDLKDTDFACPLYLDGEDWVWNIDEVLQKIQECLEYPEKREALGTYIDVKMERPF
jgi:hypothetical protein